MASSRRLQQLGLILRRLHSQHSSHNPHLIKVTPTTSRFDQPIHIKVQGLPRQVKVTLHAATETEWRRKRVSYMSCGHYLTNADGEVDLWEDSSVGGSYQGVEPMGLFWSMRPAPSHPQDSRMVVKEVTRPVLYNLSVYLGHLSLEEVEDGAGQRPVSSVILQRTVMPPSVRRLPVKEGTVRGTLFLPPGEGPFPGVIDMFGLAGGLMEVRAALLAAHGFAALALPIFAYHDLPTDFRQQTFNYFENAVDWLSSHPAVTANSLGVVATSGGGALAMMMGWKCPQVKAVVRINGSGVMSFTNMHHNGELLVEGIGLDFDKVYRQEGALVLKEAWQYPQSDKSFIPLWEREVHLLVLTSGDDQQIPAESSGLQEQLYPPHRRHLLHLQHYPGAGHLLEPPYVPFCRLCYNPFLEEVLLWGGNAKDHAVAQEESWQKILQFLGSHLSS